MHKARMMVIAAAIALASCGGGGGGNNDQGVSFRALGVFQETTEKEGSGDTAPTPEEAVGDTGRGIFLSRTLSIPNDLNRDGDLDGGFLGFENMLAFQRLNVTGVNVKIVIPGARINNPVATDFVPLSITLGRAGSTEPPVVEKEANVAYAQTIFVSTDILAFLNQNPSLLPTPPYNMNVVMTAEATSDSGETYESNEFTYNVIVLQEQP